MTVFFTKRAELDEPILIDGEPLQVGDRAYALPERAKEVLRDKKNIPEEMPFVLEEDGSYNRLLGEFFLRVESDGGTSPRTWKSYAYDIQSFRKFLAGRDGAPSLSDADRELFDAFFRSRIHGTSQREPVTYATWSRQAGTLRKFYEWLAEKTDRPSRFPSRRKGQRTFRRWRSPTIPVNSTTVKCVSMEQFDAFVKLGLSGETIEGSDQSSLRMVRRNVAFAELLVSTGMRLSEATALLKYELPANDGLHPDGSGQRMLISAATAKRAKSRVVFVPTRVLDNEIRDYLDFVRSDICASDAALSRYASQRSILAGKAFGTSQCVDASTGQKIEYAKLTVAQRRQLFSVSADGRALEPAMLWLGENGAPVTTSAFTAAFTRANDWLQREHSLNLGITPHTLRHTYSVYMLSLLIRTAIGSADDLRRERATSGTRAYQALIADPLRNLQLLLGHSSLETTSVYLTYIDQRDESLHAALASWNAREWDHLHLPKAGGE